MKTSWVVITGASSGIGRACCKQFSELGFGLFAIGRSEEKLDRLANDLEGAKIKTLSCDLSQATAIEQTLAPQLNDFFSTHSIAALINNAGIFDRVSLDESSEDLWQSHFQNNLLSAVRVTQLLGPFLKANAPSSLVNVSSTLGLRPVPQTGVYSAIKAAMINWTQSLAIEWAPFGVRANVICPGLVNTPIHDFHKGDQNQEVRDQMHAMHPLGRMGNAEDIAKTISFLAGSESGWTTGSCLLVDGGLNLAGG